MSIFFKTSNFRHMTQAYRALGALQSRQSHWLPDWKPGPYPRTKEEREAAAKKYNLLPEEYEPHPDNCEDSLGDYPKLPYESVDSKDPWYPWDNEELRKDFGEPIPHNFINLIPECVSTEPPKVSHEKGTLIFLTMCAVSFAFSYFLHKFKVVTPVLEEQRVTPNVTHYTFELEEK